MARQIARSRNFKDYKHKTKPFSVPAEFSKASGCVGKCDKTSRACVPERKRLLCSIRSLEPRKLTTRCPHTFSAHCNECCVVMSHFFLQLRQIAKSGVMIMACNAQRRYEIHFCFCPIFLQLHF